MNDLNLKLVLSADNKRLMAGVNQSVTSVKQLDVTLDHASASARDMGTTTQAAGAKAQDGISRVHEPVRQVAQHINSATYASQQFGNQASQSATRADQSFRNVEQSSESITLSLRSMAKAAAGAFLALEAGNQLSDLTEKVAAYQDMRTRLTELSGSTEAYAENEAYLIDLSKEHHKNLLTLADSYTRILVLEKAGLTSRDQARQLLEGLSNASAALGATNAQLEQSLYGIAQGMSAGMLRAEELNQVTEPLPGLLQELDKAAGVASGGFRKMVNDGQVTSAMFRDYLITALDAYNGAAQRTANNLSAKFADLENARLSLATAFEKPLADSLSAVLDGTSTALTVLADNAETVISTLEMLTALAGTRLVVALGAATQAKIKDIASSQAKQQADLQAAIASEKLAQAELSAAQAALVKARNQKSAALVSVAAAKEVETATQRVALAEAAHANSLKTVTAASQTANVAGRALAGTMALLGGPLGAASLAATAIGMFSLNSAQAKENASDLTSVVGTLAEKYKTISVIQLKSQLLDLDKEIKALDKTAAIANARVERFVNQSGGRQTQKYREDLIKAQAAAETATINLTEAEELRLKVLQQIQALESGTASSTKTENGSSYSKDAAQEFEALQSSLYTQEEAITAAYVRRQTILDDALKSEQISKTRYHELSLQLEVKFEDERANLIRQKRDAAQR